MILYASSTSTRRNLDVLRRSGWRLLVSATGHWRPHHFRYGLDNGAWTAWNQGTPWDERAFMQMVFRLGPTADWLVLPDIVAGGADSLERSLEWNERLSWLPTRKLLAVQDGMQPEDIEPLLGDELGLFIGGTTDWKLSTLRGWGGVAARTGCWMHVGRVNTVRRVHACIEAGAHSCDGTSVTRFSANASKLTNAASQLPFAAFQPKKGREER